MDEAGAVESARSLYDTPGCPDADAGVDPRFLDAALLATGQWQFAAAAICSYPPGIPQNPDCSGSGVTMELVPVKLAFVFEFRVESGRPKVRRTLNSSSKPTLLRGGA